MSYALQERKIRANKTVKYFWGLWFFRRYYYNMENQ